MNSRYDTLILERRENVSWLYLNRPQVYNALNHTMRVELRDALSAISKDPLTRIVVVTGLGKAFCAGGDLNSMGEQLGTLTEIKERLHLLQELITIIINLPQPVVAAVNGAAVGAGCNLALACDLVIAADDAIFGETFVKVALVPDAGGTFLLPRLIGLRKAKELFLSGELLTADRAEKLGLVNRVVPAGELYQAAAVWAEELAAGPALAMQLGKMLFNRSLHSSLDDMLEREVFSQIICLQSVDHLEGVKAFFEKRKPVFNKI